jgi:hypothetical protein
MIKKLLNLAVTFLAGVGTVVMAILVFAFYAFAFSVFIKLVIFFLV